MIVSQKLTLWIFFQFTELLMLQNLTSLYNHWKTIIILQLNPMIYWYMCILDWWRIGIKNLMKSTSCYISLWYVIHEVWTVLSNTTLFVWMNHKIHNNWTNHVAHEKHIVKSTIIHHGLVFKMNSQLLFYWQDFYLLRWVK